MDLTIISPMSKKIYKITWIEINTPKGNFVIQPGHAPMIMTLAKKRSVTFSLENGNRESILINEGIISIDRTSTTIITSHDV